MIFATEGMIKYRLRELQVEAARVRPTEPKARREERTPQPPRIVLYRGRWMNLKQLAAEASSL